MPRRQERVISKRTVDALSVEGRDAVFWDRDLPGFGIRVYPSGLKIYVVQKRGPSGSRRATLGRHGEISAEQARRRAAEAIDRIKQGEAPLPPSLTKRLVNHARPNDVTEGYAADWTVEQLREPAQMIADRIEALTCGTVPAARSAQHTNSDPQAK